MNQPLSIQELQQLTQEVQQLIFSFLIGFPAILALLAPFVNVFFCWSCYSVLRKIPKKARSLPAWFSWLMLIPFIGYIFEWMLLPFAIPTSINESTSSKKVINKTKRLRVVGLVYVILTLLMLIESLFFSITQKINPSFIQMSDITPILLLVIMCLAISMLIFWIVYWVTVSKTSSLLTSEVEFDRTTAIQTVANERRLKRPMVLKFLLCLTIYAGVGTVLVTSSSYHIIALSYQLAYVFSLTIALLMIKTVLIIFMFRGANWARMGYVAVFVFSVAVFIFLYASSFYLYREHVILILASMLLPLVIIMFLFLPKANQYFAQSKPSL